MMREIPAALLSAFPPSAGLLLDRARRKTDDAMLTEIARADYGWEADEMMVELRPIRDTGVVPAPLPWMLSEVLTLTMYSDPDTPNVPPFAPGPSGRRGHQTRLFACAVLLQAVGELPLEETNIDTGSVLARCLISASVLGDEMREAATCHLTWRITRRICGSDSLLFALGLLMLATRLRSGRLTEPDLGAIAKWVMEIESLDRPDVFLSLAGPRPLPFSLKRGFWRPLLAEFRKEVISIRNEEIRTDLELCGLLLESGW